MTSEPDIANEAKEFVTVYFKPSKPAVPFLRKYDLKGRTPDELIKSLEESLKNSSVECEVSLTPYE